MIWLVGLVGVVVGVALGVLVCRVPSFEFVDRVSTADLLNWIVILGLAKFLQVHWQKKYSDVRVEKDLLIENTKEAIAALKAARNSFLDCCHKRRITRENETRVKGVLRDLSNALYVLDCALEQCGERMKSVRIEEAKEHRLKYKTLLTGGNFPDKSYGELEMLDEETEYRLFHQALQYLIFKINRC